MKKTILPLIVILVVLISACTNNNVTNRHDRMEEMHQNMQEGHMNSMDDAELEQMIEHCKEMPNMRGCEGLVDVDQDHDHSLPENMRHHMGELKGDSVIRSIQNLDQVEKNTELNPKELEIIQLSADIIKKKIDGKEIRMFGYNKQIPGPVIKVKQNQKILVNFTNNLDMETTVHWHGLRLDNKFDGVPGLTQKAVLPGQSFLYELKFPDEGVYWYHPHVREDYQQELGLYGNILVEPEKSDYYNRVNSEEVMILDDILLLENDVPKYLKDSITHAMMGRFGNNMLINGKTGYELNVNKGEVVRFFITNTANTRTFNLSIDGISMKVVGGDIGNYEKEFITDSLVISSAERYIVEVLFEDSGIFDIKNINPIREYTLGKIIVNNKPTQNDNSIDFYTLLENEYVKEDIDDFRDFFEKEIDHQITLTVEMPGMGNMMQGMMHDNQKIEWEDTMAMMNLRMTNNTMTWKLVDERSKEENMKINYNFKVGDKVKIRLFNDPESAHPMQHPIHFHGQRFLVLEKDGVKNNNLVWKDTVLVPVGSTVDILLDISNPGDWMAHCHIAEHLQSGMMMVFKVT